jgi:hypothetical protein
MTDQKLQPTPHPEVNAILEVLSAGIQAILGDQLIGMYLYGSLAYGGFDRDSDVDFVVVIRTALPEPLLSALANMHAHLARLDSWCATQLEGSYIPSAALRQFDPVNILHVHIDRGPGEILKRMHIEDPLLSRAWWGGWVLLRSVLYDHGITLSGPDVKTLVDPVSADELKQATRADLQGWAAPLLEHPQEIARRGYQSYVVLTMCRMLYTLEFGSIASKPEAARWAQSSLGREWTALIERAWSGRHDPTHPASETDIKGTLAFIRFTLDKGR